MPEIKHFSADAPAESMLAAIREDGAMIIDELVDPAADRREIESRVVELVAEEVEVLDDASRCVGVWLSSLDDRHESALVSLRKDQLVLALPVLIVVE